MGPMTDDELAEIEAEFCPAPGVVREPSHGVPELVAEVRRLRAIVAERATPTCSFYMLAGDEVVVSEGAWWIRPFDDATEVLCIVRDGPYVPEPSVLEQHVLIGQDVRWNHGVFAAANRRMVIFVDVSKRVPVPAEDQ